jgi:hypothetical protein
MDPCFPLQLHLNSSMVTENMLILNVSPSIFINKMHFLANKRQQKNIRLSVDDKRRQCQHKNVFEIWLEQGG